MRKKIFSLICMMSAILLLGACIPGNGNTGKDDNPGNAVLTDTDEKDPVTVPAPDTQDEADVTVTEPEENGISNNGGYFVGVDGKVYFIQYRDYGITGTAFYRGFLGFGTGGTGNTICCFSPDNPDDISVVAENVNCIGKLYYSDGYLYSMTYDWDNGYPYPKLCRVNISTGEYEVVGDGFINTVSADSSYIVASDYSTVSEERKMLVFSNGKEIGSYAFNLYDGNVSVITVDEKYLYILKSDFELKSSTVIQYDYANGTQYVLCEILPPSDIDEYLTYTEVRNGSINESTLNFSLCYCSGIEDFIDAAKDVSVQINTNGGEGSDEPMFTAQTKENKELPGLSDVDILIPENLASMEKLDNLNSGDHRFARAVQCVEKVYDRNYAIFANSYLAQGNVQAQMGSWNLLSLDYYYFDKDSDTPTLFNEENAVKKDIIVKGWFIGKKGFAPESLLFQYAGLSGPEGPVDLDSTFYMAEFSDDFKFSHVPDGGDIYDEQVLDGMDYLVDYLNQDYYESYLDKAEPDEFYNYKAPREDWNDTSCPAFGYFHIYFDREGKINLLRYVIMD
ncbi:MAG: DUF5050 domain-containing protein [Lachnospiraceae bacterium]|nr:DUF5050 domain-containing protein [Lachnospiraceae bacterium]